MEKKCTFLPRFSTTNVVDPEAGLVGETCSVRSVIVTLTDAAAPWLAPATPGRPSAQAATAATAPPRMTLPHPVLRRSLIAFLPPDVCADGTRGGKGVSTENAGHENVRVSFLF